MTEQPPGFETTAIAAMPARCTTRTVGRGLALILDDAAMLGNADAGVRAATAGAMQQTTMSARAATGRNERFNMTLLQNKDAPAKVPAGDGEHVWHLARLP